MNESVKPATNSPFPPTKVKMVDFRKVYALLYRAYIRSQSPKNGSLNDKEENSHE